MERRQGLATARAGLFGCNGNLGSCFKHYAIDIVFSVLVWFDRGKILQPNILQGLLLVRIFQVYICMGAEVHLRWSANNSMVDPGNIREKCFSTYKKIRSTNRS